MPRQANQTSFKTGNRLAREMERNTDGTFVGKRRFDWTNVDAPETASRLYEGDGTPTHRTQFPSKAHPWPRNHLDLGEPITPLQASKLTHGEIITLTAMSVIGIALIVSGLVWL